MPPKHRTLKKQVSLTSNPPPHPYENDSTHRSFLSRSLDKSDTELHALVKLNASLKELKEYILSNFGMAVLLDIGEGFITLNRITSDGTGTGSGTGSDGSLEDLVIKHSPAISTNTTTTVSTGNADDSGSSDVDNETKDNTASNHDNNDDVNDDNNDDGNDDTNNGDDDDDDDDDDKQEKVKEKENKNSLELKPASSTSEETKTNSSNKNSNSISQYQCMNDPTFKPIIKSFILRLKLRRKLLNRLSRRLLRLSHSMDGKLHKINPPMLPKYGTSFEKHANNTIKDKVIEWNKDFECREEVLEKLWSKKDELSKRMQKERVEREKINGVEKKKQEEEEQVKEEQEQVKQEVVAEDKTEIVKSTDDGEKDEEMKEGEKDVPAVPAEEESATNTKEGEKEKEADTATEEKEEPVVDTKEGEKEALSGTTTEEKEEPVVDAKEGEKEKDGDTAKEEKEEPVVDAKEGENEKDVDTAKEEKEEPVVDAKEVDTVKDEPVADAKEGNKEATPGTTKEESVTDSKEGENEKEAIPTSTSTSTDDVSNEQEETKSDTNLVAPEDKIEINGDDSTKMEIDKKSDNATDEDNTSAVLEKVTDNETKDDNEQKKTQTDMDIDTTSSSTSTVKDDEQSDSKKKAETTSKEDDKDVTDSNNDVVMDDVSEQPKEPVETKNDNTDKIDNANVKQEGAKEETDTLQKDTQPDRSGIEEKPTEGPAKVSSSSSIKMVANNESDKKNDNDDSPHDTTDSATTTKSLSPVFKNDPFLLDAEHQKDLEKLIQYDTDYDRKETIHIPTSTIIKSTTALSKEELAALDKDEDDFDDTANAEGKKDMNHGIGAVSKFMTKKEKVMEWKRWQTEFLSKIPDQPTFKELGLEHRVFFSEERRKMCMDELKRQKDGDVKDQENAKNDEEEGKGGEGMEIDSNSGSDGDKGKKSEDEDVTLKKRKREQDEISNDESDNDDSIDKSKKDTKEKDADTTILKRKRISLDPVPSFHQQDYSRILMIQSATLSAALSSSTRDAYVQANNEYQQIFLRSQNLQSRKTHLENELQKAMYDYRVKVTSMTNNAAIAKAKWESDKKVFESRKIQRIQMNMQMSRNAPLPGIMEAMTMSDNRSVKRVLTAAVDRVVIRNAPLGHATGSRYTSAVLHRTAPHSIQNQVATTIAHCVDVVTQRVEKGWLSDAIIDAGKSGEQFPAFVPPKTKGPEYVVINANGETFTQVQKRIDAEVKKVKADLAVSESARSKAWSRLNKTKAALNGRNGGGANTSSQKSHRPKSSSTASSPKYSSPTVVQRYNPPAQPPRANYRSQVTVANNPAVASAAAAAAAVKANNMKMGGPIAPTSTTQSGPQSENKYSLERVRARMYSDGSVLPVSLPKRGKDGLYLRPAGRQRKGMDWDAVNGKWVPQQGNH